MNRLASRVLYSIFILGVFTQCDSVVSSNDQAESYSNPPTETTQPSNDDVQPVTTTLEWQSTKGADSYRILIATSDNFENPVTDTAVTGNAFTTPPMLPGSTFSWKVYPNKSDDSGSWSEVQRVTVESGEKISDTEVTLIAPVNNADKVYLNLEFSWHPFSGATEYDYQLSDDSGFGYFLDEATVEGTSYEPNNLTERKKYYWRVKVSGDDSGETWSETRSFTTGTEISDPDPEDTIVTLIAPANDADKVSTNLEFSWDSFSGAAAYDYQLSDDSGFGYFLDEATVEGTTYQPDNLTQRKKYFWRVKVSDDDSGETWSETRSFTTGTGSSEPNPDPDPDETTVSLVAPQNNADKVSTDLEFSWESLSGTTEYVYQLSDDSGFGYFLDEVTVDGTTYAPNNLTQRKKYYWRVKAFGDASGETMSETRSFTTGAGDTPPPFPPDPTPPSPTGSFVEVQNSNFVKDGSVMRFAGTNAYYLPNYEKLNPAVVDDAFDLFQDTGVTVVRMWGFYDGYDCGYSRNDPNENVIQTAPGEYSESALRDLDKVIAKGKEHGVGFIIPFINYWDQLGGVCQYNTWAGASDPSTNMDFFLNNNDTQQWYKDYISMLLNRVNTETGVAYKDEPAIVSWQIMNEGRNSGADPTILRDWYQEMAQYIKSIDPNHLISTGEEGFDEGTPSEYSAGEYSNTYTLRANEGTSYVMNTAIPEIDYGNAHWYPSEYGFGIDIDEDLLRGQRAWIDDHKAIAESHGKPFMIGEFGFPGWGDERVSTMYSALYEHAETKQLDGNLLWQLTADGTKCWEFGGNICFPGGRTDTGLYNDFKDHVSNLQN